MDTSHVLNCWVTFRIADVLHPDQLTILNELHREDTLQGKVVAFSNGDQPDQAFAAVEVEGIEQKLIVPLASIRDAAVIE